MCLHRANEIQMTKSWIDWFLAALIPPGDYGKSPTS